MDPTPRTRRARRFFDTYTKDLKSEDVQRLFTRDTREAYRFFAREIDRDALARLPWLKRQWVHAGLFARAVMMRLSPARRALYGVALACAVIGLLKLFSGFTFVSVPLGPLFAIPVLVPSWVDGAMWLLWSLVATNLLVLLEVADRLSLKDDLEIAREIQQAMLPAGTFSTPELSACGLTRPANTVGGDFYDILPTPGGDVIVALGDVAGKGSPAALLMALLLAMMRTLVDEGLDGAALLDRLNIQVSKHSPASRFITLFYARYEPASGRLTYVNAGHTPALLQRRDGSFERLLGGGVALGMFEGSTYEAHETTLAPGDLLVIYSDGITEAESPAGQPFEEAGLEAVLREADPEDPRAIGRTVLAAVERHAQDFKLADDLTVLLLRRHQPA
jgi:sigma-B regulation protein RsbU (phosphoserine phosphatase)